MRTIPIFWFLASKGGAGKTFLSLCLHRSLFDSRIYNPTETLLLDLNTQNKDMFNILRKVAVNKIEIINISTERREVPISIVKLREPNLYLATPNTALEITEYILLPIKLASILEISNIIVDTNLNLSSFYILGRKQLEHLNQEIESAKNNGIDPIPIMLYIWTTGSITRHMVPHYEQTTFELEAIMGGIAKISRVFDIQPQIFSMKNLIVVINSTLWIYNTIMILKTVLKNLQKELINTIRKRENIALYSFTRIARDVVLRASQITAQLLSSISGKKPRFKYMEPLYIISLYYLLFGETEKIVGEIEKNVKVPEEIALLVEKLKTEEKLKIIPTNLYVVPPPADIYNMLPFIFSSHLLGPDDFKNILADEDAAGLPYKLIQEQAKYFAEYLIGYFKVRRSAGTY